MAYRGEERRRHRDMDHLDRVVYSLEVIALNVVKARRTLDRIEAKMDAGSGAQSVIDELTAKLKASNDRAQGALDQQK